MMRHGSILALVFAFASALGRAGSSDTSWVANDVSVLQTMPGQDGSEQSRLETGENGDTRITFDLRGGGKHAEGTIVIVADRWMLIQGFTPRPGVEIDEMDIAILNCQLVVRLLEAALPKGPPAPGTPARFSVSEKIKPIQVGTPSAFGEYGPPWTVDGTVDVPSKDAPANYQLMFTYFSEGHSTTMKLVGRVGSALLSLPDATPLAGWAVHRLGHHQHESSNSTGTDQSARPETSPAATIGDLRKN
jgi:hypothetical protein